MTTYSCPIRGSETSPPRLIGREELAAPRLFPPLCCSGNSLSARRMVDFCSAVLSLGDEALLGAIVDMNTVLRGIESKLSSKVARGLAESGDVKTSAEDLAALLRRVSESSTREIEELINQLQNLRTQLQNSGDRIQRDIARYTELNQQTMQVTAIISDSVKKLPTGASSLLH
jgi:hypothetical protein